LTIAPSATWTGLPTVYSQAPNLTFANQGTINFSSGNAYICSNGSTGNGLVFANTGTVNVTGGSLGLGYYASDSVTNGGTIEADGGTIYWGDNVSTATNLQAARSREEPGLPRTAAPCH